MSTWLGHRLPRYLVKNSGCFCRMFLDELALKLVNWVKQIVSGPFRSDEGQNRTKRLDSPSSTKINHRISWVCSSPYRSWGSGSPAVAWAGVSQFYIMNQPHISPEDVMYSVVSTINNTLLHISKRVNLKVIITRKSNL